jgi:hypothetical protein
VVREMVGEEAMIPAQIELPGWVVVVPPVVV